MDVSRPLRVCVPGGVYHVISRGNERRPIFRSEWDRAVLLAYLGEVAEKLGWSVLTYVLMGNHYHAVVKVEKGDLSAGMRLLNGSYAQYFNLRYQRSGHLFQGRFSSSFVDTDAYLANLLCYVVLNPVRAGLRTTADGWRWSAHHALNGTQTDALVAVEKTLNYLDSDINQARQTYREMVNDRTPKLKQD